MKQSKITNGREDTVVAGPEVQRFDELKVGDKVNMTYTEAVLVSVQRPT